jgi:hypothetical protein
MSNEIYNNSLLRLILHIIASQIDIYYYCFQILSIIEDEDDINQITDFFSYEHFYVIYCKFWELDKDHDLFIDKTDLARHNEHGKFV